MDTLKHYSQSAQIRTFQTFEWALGALHRFRAWIPFAFISMGVGFAIGYLFLGR
jgi:hypothetical protein